MEKVSAAKARKSFADILDQVSYAKERIIITRRGKAVAAVVPIEDLELLEAIEDKIDLEDYRKAPCGTRGKHSLGKSEKRVGPLGTTAGKSIKTCPVYVDGIKALILKTA